MAPAWPKIVDGRKEFTGEGHSTFVDLLDLS